jgi:hypothetical protein
VDPTSLRPICLTLAVLAILAGAAGMVLSFLYLASASMADITAGTSGFVVGSVLIGSGLLSLTLLATRGDQTGPATPPEPNRQGSDKVVTLR